MEYKEILDYVNKNFISSKVITLKQEASLRKYYRITNNRNSYIIMDSSKDHNRFNSYLKVYDIIKNYKVTIPQIINYDLDKKIIILEDFGTERFDKLINDSLKRTNLLKIAVESLAVFKNSIKYNNSYFLPEYNIKIFINEISEFIDWYYPFIYKRNINNKNKSLFLDLWKKLYNEVDLNLKSFVHKDYFCNNLFYLSSRVGHLQCGIIDFQDAYWGDDALDLVSLLQDSRMIVNLDINDDLIDYYLIKTNRKEYKKEFIKRLNFLGAARQTRLLGRWVKLYNTNYKSDYLNFINSTWYWLEKNLNHEFLCELKSLLDKMIPKNNRKYEN